MLSGDRLGLDSLLSEHPELKKHFSEPLFLEDFKPEELFGMIDVSCRSFGLHLSPEARQKLEMYVLYKYNHRGMGFTNAHLVNQLFRDQISDYLETEESGKLELAEQYASEQDFQMLLITHVEMIIDLDDLLFYFREIALPDPDEDF
ncbi:MAG: hypothetical protein IJQ69_07670 [Bacteroidales bacterium]|nr:hypothetical protein [Bacteroidales bacterium]